MWSNHYLYDSGNLYRLYKRHNHPVGAKVGYLDKRGYIRTKLDGKMTFAHRVIWEMHFGSIPEGLEIDHINGIKHDNRIENLRIATRAVNCKNAAMRKDNKSGVTGISFNSKKNAWIVQIQCDKVSYYRQCPTIEEARLTCNEIYSNNNQFTDRHGK